LRYVSPTGGYGNVAEVQFIGNVSGLSAPQTPGQISATLTNPREATVQWGSVAGAERYNLKRSTVKGGPYAIVASGAFTGFADPGLGGNTTYFYVVSAVNKMGESTNSTETTVATDP
jgi:hypothetical protein